MKRKKRSRESGQGVIEFILTTMMLLTMIFVFVELSWAVAWGHYVHYATYMAARAYYSAAVGRNIQYENAASVLASYVKNSSGQDRIPFISRSRTGDDRDAPGTPEPISVPGAFIGEHPLMTSNENNRAYDWAEGVQFNFNVPLYVLPLAGWIKTEGIGQSIEGGTAQSPTKATSWNGSIPFTSDAYLGRERTVQECLQDMLRLPRGRADGAAYVEDNGC